MVLYQNNDLANVRTWFLLKDYAFFIIVAVVLCFPIVPWVRKKLVDKAAAFKVFELVEYVVIITAFIWALSFVVAGQNNPFAYANF